MLSTWAYPQAMSPIVVPALGRPLDFVGRPPGFNAIQRLTQDGDAKLLTLPPGLYGSEPMFAPRAEARAEGDGDVLEVVYDGYKHRSELQILDAESFEPRAVLALKHHVPHQFHGHFTSDVFVSSA